jgi:aryl-alcohol dehydrogenase-like predicted oxidoreductase
VTVATPEIERRRLGRSDVIVPRIALGCGNFGGVGSAPDFFGHGIQDDAAMELMDAAWEMGITHFDTADAYGGGRSERVIGRWIESRGVRPTLTTKTFNPMYAGGDQGLAPERIAEHFRSSLERLGVRWIDVYLAHDFDPNVPLADTCAAFEELKRANRIGAYGVSNFTAMQLEDALSAGEPQAIQNSHSLLDRGDERYLLPLCAEREVAYLVFGPLYGGWLTGKYRRGEPFPLGSRMTQRPEPYEPVIKDATFDSLERLEAIATERKTSIAATALAWLLADDRVTQIVTGPGRPEHLAPVKEALENPLTPEERDRISEVFG